MPLIRPQSPSIIRPRGFVKPSRPILDPTHPLSDGLVGAWVMGEGNGAAGTRLNDISFSGNHASLSNFTGNPWGSSHHGGLALYFDGSDDVCDTSMQVRIVSSFSFACWVRPRIAPQGSFDRIAETDFGSAFFLGTSNAGNAYDWIVNANSPTGGLDSIIGGTITAGAWDLLLGTFEGGVGRLYVDGVQVNSLAGITTPTTALKNLRLGGYVAGGGFNWDGAIEFARYWHRCLTPTEAAWIYAEPYAGVRSHPQRSYYYSVGAGAGDTLFAQSVM